MKSLRCAKCEITVAGSWAWIWYPHEFTERSASSGKERKRTLWLCPDCAGGFAWNSPGFVDTPGSARMREE